MRIKKFSSDSDPFLFWPLPHVSWIFYYTRSCISEYNEEEREQDYRPHNETTISSIKHIDIVHRIDRSKENLGLDTNLCFLLELEGKRSKRNVFFFHASFDLISMRISNSKRPRRTKRNKIPHSNVFYDFFPLDYFSSFFSSISSYFLITHFYSLPIL